MLRSNAQWNATEIGIQFSQYAILLRLLQYVNCEFQFEFFSFVHFACGAQLT